MTAPKQDVEALARAARLLLQARTGRRLLGLMARPAGHLSPAAAEGYAAGVGDGATDLLGCVVQVADRLGDDQAVLMARAALVAWQEISAVATAEAEVADGMAAAAKLCDRWETEAQARLAEAGEGPVLLATEVARA